MKKDDLSAKLPQKIKFTAAFLILTTTFAAAGESNNIARADANLATYDTQFLCQGNTEETEGDSSGGEYSGKTDAKYDMEVISAVYDVMNGEYGISAKMVAAILGNWQQESGLRPGVVNSIGASGLGQWLGARLTGGNGEIGLKPYAKKQGKDWDDPALQAEFAVVAETDSRHLKIMAEDGHEDIDKYAEYFGKEWERAGADEMAMDKRKMYANEIYEAMKKEGMDGKMDAKKIKKIAPNVGGGSVGGASASDASSEEETANYCGSTEDSGGGAANWGGDGKGTHKYANGTEWSPDEVPKDMKKYALDPKSLGMKWKDGAGWTNPGGQCVHFSTSMFYALWLKGGKPNPKGAGGSGGKVPGLSYNGVDSGKLAAAEYGGKIKKKPSKGSIWGVHGPDKQYGQANTDAGHTGIVSHVFADGSVLMVEQNWTKSGDNGTASKGAMTWNYRIVSKKVIDTGIFDFYSPEKEGYEHNKKIKTL